jgi:hypothetical protein
MQSHIYTRTGSESLLQGAHFGKSNMMGIVWPPTLNSLHLINITIFTVRIPVLLTASLLIFFPKELPPYLPAYCCPLPHHPSTLTNTNLTSPPNKSQKFFDFFPLRSPFLSLYSPLIISYLHLPTKFPYPRILARIDGEYSNSPSITRFIHHLSSTDLVFDSHDDSSYPY